MLKKLESTARETQQSVPEIPFKNVIAIRHNTARVISEIFLMCDLKRLRNMPSTIPVVAHEKPNSNRIPDSFTVSDL